jgi:hypothetical protein
MNRTRPALPAWPFALLAAGVAALVSGFAFAGWLRHGSDILLGLAENGMSWCF